MIQACPHRSHKPGTLLKHQKVTAHGGWGYLLLSFHHSGYQCQRLREGRGPWRTDQGFSLPLGKPYSENWTAKWSYLYPLATNIPNTGFFTFTPKPALPQYQRWKVGALRISSSQNYPGKQ